MILLLECGGYQFLRAEVNSELIPKELLVEFDADKLERRIWNDVYSREPVSNRAMQDGYGLIEQVWSAKLLFTYAQLAAQLDESARKALSKEQIAWSRLREDSSTANVADYGSESYLRASKSFVEMTKNRVIDLDERLKVLLARSGGRSE